MQAVCLDELGVVAESSGRYLFPFVAVVQHCVGGFLGEHCGDDYDHCYRTHSR